MSITLPEKSLPTIAIVGRTNVGKSTLFNRLVEKKKALVSNVAGTTRTSNIDTFFWRGKKYRLIDTGGLDYAKDIPLEEEIKKQITTALKEAQLILWVTDLRTGLLPQEKIWLKDLRRSKLPIILVGNKADNARARASIHDSEWLILGLGEPMPISSANGVGVGDLLDRAIKSLKFPRGRQTTLKTPPLRVALIGRPNVGKSTLFNALIGEERVIISDIAHTTRESHDTLVLVDDEPFLFVDTAGIRRHSRMERGLEEQGVGQAITTLARADVVLLLLDATAPFTAQDMHLVQIVQEKHKNLVLIINKWDLSDETGDEAKESALDQIYARYPFLQQVPAVFVSAKTKLSVHKIYNLIKLVYTNSQKEIEERTLRLYMKFLMKKHLPSRDRGTRFPKIYYLKQVGTNPPTFEVAVKQKTSLHESYLRYIANNLQEKFDFTGAPVVVYAKKIRV
jgi:GTP-binding protein